MTPGQIRALRSLEDMSQFRFGVKVLHIPESYAASEVGKLERGERELTLAQRMRLWVWQTRHRKAAGEVADILNEGWPRQAAE